MLLKGTDDENNWKCAIKVDKPGCDFKSEVVNISGVSLDEISEVFYGNENNPDIWENETKPQWKVNGKNVDGECEGATLHLVRRLYVPAEQKGKYLQWTLEHTTIKMPDGDTGFPGEFKVNDTLQYVGG